MANNIGPPPTVVDLLHLGPVLTYIANAVYADLQNRDILIANQNSQQEQLSQFLAALTATTSAISSGTAQLSANIAELGSANAEAFVATQAAFADLKTDLTGRIDALTTKIDDVTTLLEATIQAFQGAATLDAQNQELALLQQLAAASPERARSLSLDLSTGVTLPQPIPAKPGP